MAQWVENDTETQPRLRASLAQVQLFSWHCEALWIKAPTEKNIIVERAG